MTSNIPPSEDRLTASQLSEPQPFGDALRGAALLLETSRTKWQYGEWRDLAAIALDQIEDHPDRARVALLIGAAKAQLGEIDAARVAIKRAAAWGCGRELIARVLASTIHNSLGRIAACLDDDEGATHHFEAAIGLMEPRADAALMARTRRVRETARLGLVQDAARLLGEDLGTAKTAPADHAARVGAIRAEIDLIGRELSHLTQGASGLGQEAPHHPIFKMFSSVPSMASGHHVYDFLGGATRVAYNGNWARFAPPADKTMTPNLPPRNEHYLDWIAVLTAAAKAHGVFRMAELGAGWAPWLIRGALAARQRAEISECELLGLEPDPSHFSWAREHFLDNGLDPDRHRLLQGVATAEAGPMRFPVVASPDLDYSASIADADEAETTIEVQGYDVIGLLRWFSGPVDLLHVDIQGAEHHALPPAMAMMAQSVRAIMIGTHDGDDLHDDLARRLREDGWRERTNLGASRVHATPWGEITTDDGFLWFENSRTL